MPPADSHSQLANNCPRPLLFSFLFYSLDVYHGRFLFVWRVHDTFFFRKVFFYLVITGSISASAYVRIQSNSIKSYALRPEFIFQRGYKYKPKEEISDFLRVSSIRVQPISCPLPPSLVFGASMRHCLFGGCRAGLTLKRCNQLAVFAI